MFTAQEGAPSAQQPTQVTPQVRLSNQNPTQELLSLCDEPTDEQIRSITLFCQNNPGEKGTALLVGKTIEEAWAIILLAFREQRSAEMKRISDLYGLGQKESEVQKILAAIEKHDLRQIEALANRENINVTAFEKEPFRSYLKQAPLHKAAHAFGEEIMRYLLTLAPDINIRSIGDYDEMTPLHWGVYILMGGGQEETLQMLLDAGADLSLKTIDLQTREEKFTTLELANTRANEHLIPLLTLYSIVKPYVPTPDEILINDIKEKFLTQMQMQSNPPFSFIETQKALYDYIAQYFEEFGDRSWMRNRVEISEKLQGLRLNDTEGRKNIRIAQDIFHRSLYNTIFNRLYPKLYPSIQKIIEEQKNTAALAEQLKQTQLSFAQAASSVAVESALSSASVAASNAAQPVSAPALLTFKPDILTSMEGNGRLKEHVGVEISGKPLDFKELKILSGAG